MRRKKQEPKEASRRRQKELDSVADRFAAFRPARDVLRRVTAVPTIFVQYDHATGVGGHPIERFALLHGPSGHGKTIMALGLILSFLKRAHYGALVDAEFTTPMDWVETLFGDFARCDQFLALHPESFEQTVDGVRKFTNGLVHLRAEKMIGADTSALLVLDSLKKLVPVNILKRIQEGAEKQGVDGMRGMAAMIKAAMNASWLDELTPLLFHTRTAMIAIERETERDDEVKVGGGVALIYDSSLVIRVQRAGWVYERERERDDEGPAPPAIGERHRITIRKTKIAQKDDKVTVAYFHTSNGTVVPEGFDAPRDVLELAEKFGIVHRSGAWYSFDGAQIGQGKMNAVKKLWENRQLCDEIERTCRAQFSTHDAEEEVPGA